MNVPNLLTTCRLLLSAVLFVLLGLASDGVHSNGYSLVRRVVERSGLGWDAPAPFGQGTLGEALLTPTRLYVRPARAAMAAGSARWWFSRGKSLYTSRTLPS